jgi:hypothetical protein
MKKEPSLAPAARDLGRCTKASSGMAKVARNARSAMAKEKFSAHDVRVRARLRRTDFVGLVSPFVELT